jgi:streptogramin lyase
MIIDPSPSTPTINRTTLSGASNVGINGNKYSGGALAPNGKIYFAPSTVSTIGYVDASASIPTCASFNITTPTGSSPYYAGCVLAPNGKIYCIPFSSTTVGVIDPATNGFSQPITGITGNNKFVGGVLAPNGKIYCIPYQATDVMIIDPSANTVDRTSISLTGVVPSLTTKFQGGVLAPNGKIYCVPYAADYVLIINTGLPTNPSWMLAPEFNKF